MSKITLLFVAKNRLAFTIESLESLYQNTDWGLVHKMLIVDDGSVDGTAEHLSDWAAKMSKFVDIAIDTAGGYGAPAAVMNAFADACETDIFAKIDNDVIVPPGWLTKCIRVFDENPELDLLGIEPPESRVPSSNRMVRKPAPEREGTVFYTSATTGGKIQTAPASAIPKDCVGYAKCDSIGGIGLMRKRAFTTNEKLRPHSTYGGFTEWQLEHPRVRKGWMCPPLKVFLLDRVPINPYAECSEFYERNRWQRFWTRYPVTSGIWEWWLNQLRLIRANHAETALESISTTVQDRQP